MSDRVETIVEFFRRSFLVLSVGLYLVAFGAPYDESTRGVSVFVGGLFWCWLITATFPWWANVLYWIALRYYFHGELFAAAIVGLMAAAVGSTWAYLDSHASEVLAFRLWIGAMVVLGVGSMGLSAWRARNIYNSVRGVDAAAKRDGPCATPIFELELGGNTPQRPRFRHDTPRFAWTHRIARGLSRLYVEKHFCRVRLFPLQRRRLPPLHRMRWQGRLPRLRSRRASDLQKLRRLRPAEMSDLQGQTQAE